MEWILSIQGLKLVVLLVTKAVAKFENNPEALYQAGINYAVDQITDLVANGADGIHLYSMNKPKTATDIFNNIKNIL